MSHAARAVLSSRTPVHVTLRLAQRLPSLRTRPNHRVVLDCLAAATKKGFRVVHYAVMSNHLHLVCEASDATSLSRGVQGLCVRIARGLNRLWLRFGTVFDDRYHVRQLRTPREVRNALNYVLQNAVKHSARLCETFDPFSSARWFDGWERWLEREVADDCPLPDAETWLLNLGWQMWGLLVPARR